MRMIPWATCLTAAVSCATLFGQTVQKDKSTSREQVGQKVASSQTSQPAIVSKKPALTPAAKETQKAACLPARPANQTVRPLDDCSGGCSLHYCIIGDTYPCQSPPCYATKNLAWCGVGDNYYAGYDSLLGCQGPVCGPATCSDYLCGNY